MRTFANFYSLMWGTALAVPEIVGLGTAKAVPHSQYPYNFTAFV
jgi:hypothetical protein